MLNREIFFTEIRETLFNAHLTQLQVESINYLLDECERKGVTDNNQIAYILATPYHETAKTMQPIEEYGKGHGRKYGIPVNGHIYYGRGFVQLTWDYNYEKAGEKLNVPLLQHPELALQPDIAAKILITGMVEGWFTGKRLSTYINFKICDFTNARRIINGLDCATLIAGYANIFKHSIEHSTQ